MYKVDKNNDKMSKIFLMLITLSQSEVLIKLSTFLVLHTGASVHEM